MTKGSQKLKSVLEEFNYIFTKLNFTVEKEKKLFELPRHYIIENSKAH